MGISDANRKALWSNSGSRCALCRKKLVEYVKDTNTNVIIGQECHMVSKQPNGPRHAIIKDYEHYDNFILMCANDHALIDKQPGLYTHVMLLMLKLTHEKWVDEVLNFATSDFSENLQNIALPRINSGKELIEILNGVYFYHFDEEEALTDDEASYLSVFFEVLENHVILSGMDILDKSDLIIKGRELNPYIKQLENIGYIVFGERRNQEIHAEGNDIGKYDVAVVFLVRKDSTYIVPRSIL